MNFNKAWNKRRILDRVRLARASGLEGKIGSASWGDITKEEQKAIVDTILRLSSSYKKRRAKIISTTAKKLGVSKTYLEGTGQKWLQEGRAPTWEEFRDWARNQHQRACKYYEPAWPLDYYHGKCAHMIFKKKPCTSFFSHTGICETGYFEPERISITTWGDFQKAFKKATRKVKRILEVS